MTLRKPGQVSLERALSKLGYASRTQARQLILDGHVKINGRIEKNPARAVTPERLQVEISGERINKQEQLVILLNKTRGTVTTRSDEHDRPTVFSLLPEDLKNVRGLHAVGRLDLATTGLLLLTNDTRLSSWLTDPANRIARTYRVVVRGELTHDHHQQILRGIESEVGLLQVAALELLKSSARESSALVTLEEGKNREIRRIFEALGREVTDLRRLSFSSLELGDLAPGKTRVLSSAELDLAFPQRPRSTTLKGAR